MNYRQEAQELLNDLGGVDNIRAMTHSSTRLRFALEDMTRVDLNKMSQLPSVRGTTMRFNQLQVVVGERVSEFYKAFATVSGLSDVGKDFVHEAALEPTTRQRRRRAQIAEALRPLIPLLLLAGLFVGLSYALDALSWLLWPVDRTATFCVSWLQLSGALLFVGQMIFNFLPIGVSWSVMRSLKASETTGIVIGVGLILPQLFAFLPADSVILTSLFEFRGIHTPVFLAAGVAWFAAMMERFLKDHLNQQVYFLIGPLLTTIVAVIGTHWVLIPAWIWLSSGIALWSQKYLLLQSAGLSRLIWGASYPIITLLGLNQFVLPELQSYASMMWFALAASILAYRFKRGGRRGFNQVSFIAMAEAIAGVTEPSLYILLIRRLGLLIATCVGSATGSLVLIEPVTVEPQYVQMGIFTFLFTPWTAMRVWLLAGSVAVAISLALTVWFAHRYHLSVTTHFINDESEIVADSDSGLAIINEEVVVAPVTGELITMETVGDDVFSKEIMGEGFAIEPSDRTVVSPIDGRVTSVFKTKHAIGITSPFGAQTLLHMGINTVELEGKGFDLLIEKGDQIERGTVIARMDIAYIHRTGREATVIVAFTNSDDLTTLRLSQEGFVHRGEVIGRLSLKPSLPNKENDEKGSS